MQDVPIDQHALFPAGPQAARIGASWDISLIVMCSVCVLIVGMVTWAVLRQRKVSAEEPALSEDVMVSDPARSVRQLDPSAEAKRERGVIISTAVTVFALIALLVESVLAGNALDALPTEGALRVSVVGRQWWWAIKYPAAGIQTANELHIPVGVPVVLQLAAADVIHSFWAPNLHGKRDLIPGRPTELALRADRIGSYRAQCAEFCGLAHAEMALWVHVESRADFDAWSARQRAPARQPRSAQEQHGLEVFENATCAFCHTISGTGARGDQGPDLSHVASRTSLAAGTLSNTRAQLTRWLTEPQHVKPGNRMPAPQLSAAELDDLVSYLEALQ